MQGQTGKIPVGISACLLGDPVRYNGGHKKSAFCTAALTDYFEFHRFCPEVAIGLGVPRQTIRLVGEFNSPRAQTPAGDLDVTEPLTAYATAVAEQAKHFSGYILMQKSPSCGLSSTQVYIDQNPLPGVRAGVFAQTLHTHLPFLPMEEEARLNDFALRENFIARIYAFHDWRVNFLPQAGVHTLVQFHSRYKYYVMAHGQTLYRNLGQLVAQAGAGEFERIVKTYQQVFFTGIVKPPTRCNHVNVLYHILGYLKKHVKTELKQDLLKSVEDYRMARVSLSVPIMLLKHYLTHFANDYINQQVYLNPHPEALGLRNQIF